MERAISQEERIRKAEEVYYRRKQEYPKNYSRRVVNYETNKGKNIRFRIIKKMLKQIEVCFFIYLIIYLFVNSEYFFSENVNNEIKKYMNYNINFSSIVDNIKEYLSEKYNIFNKDATNEEDVIVNENEEVNSEIENTKMELINENGIGGAEVTELVQESKSQEEINVEYIKNNYGIIWPVNGVITSKYGERTPTDIITANHYGLDIGANTGTDIIAAMDGNVSVVSSYGDYGKHIQIDNGNVSTLYAHCSQLFVSEGENVVKGQKIAEVGETRKSDRTTFTF